MSTGLELLADEADGMLYAAIVRKGVLIDLYADPLNPPSAAWASIYLGKVMKLDTRLNAAIVDLGEGMSGYLPAKHTLGEGDIADRLRGGQMILVQVKSEAKNATLHESHKIPRLTMKLHVPGMFLIHTPKAAPGEISSRIDKEVVPEAVARLKGSGGWIVQRAAGDAPAADIEHEARYLRELGQMILAAGEQRDKPGRLKAGPNALVRALCDYGAPAFDHIHVGSKPLLELMTGWCARHLPALATSKRLRLFKPEKPGQKLFDIYDVFSELEALREEQVILSSGGSIIIEATSAMTVIDVNQGSAESIAAANQSAAQEIARQCRLRNLSGAILIDFINMEQRNERARLLEAMEQLFTRDVGSAQVHGFTRLGIIEMTRKRRTASLAEKLKKNQAVS